jgi:DNA-binding transcriptional LysR family regulator
MRREDVAMTFTQLECFCAVGKYLNFNTAAEKLYISQPAVSKQILNLEAELGYKLFNRNTRSVIFTEKGYSFYTYAEQIIHLYYESLRIGSEKPSILVGYFENSNDYLFSHYLVPFLDNYPDISVNPVKITAQEVDSAFDEKRIDCLFSAGTLLDQNPSYRFTHLFDANYCALMLSSHKLAYKESLTITDLDGIQLLGTPKRNLSGNSKKIEDAIKAHCPSCHISNENISLDKKILMVLSGQYIALFPNYACLHHNDLSAIPIAGEYQFSYGLFAPQKTDALTYKFIQFCAGIL